MKYIITENKLKSFISDRFGLDLTGKISEVTSKWEIPMEFDEIINQSTINRYLNQYGPMYVIETDDNMYLTQPRGENNEWITIDKKYKVVVYESELLSKLGIGQLGISIGDLISMYY